MPIMHYELKIMNYKKTKMYILYSFIHFKIGIFARFIIFRCLTKTTTLSFLDERNYENSSIA